MKRFFVYLLAVLIMALGAGCQFLESTPASPVAEEVSEDAAIDLDSPTGGLTASDEQPAFGEEDGEYLRSLAVEPLYDDPIQEDARIKAAENNRYARVFKLRAIWGHLIRAAADSADYDCCTIDWSGGIRFDGGFVVVQKLIAFDAGDSMTRIDRSTIEWVSHTCPHVDGIEVILIQPNPTPNSADSLDFVPMVHFKAGAYEHSFTLEELASFQENHWVDRCGNGIMISSRLRPFGCQKGYLFGAWQAIEPDTIYSEATDSTEAEMRGVLLGLYRGVWMGDNGMAAGFVKGFAGTNSEGENVIFGKFIDLEGRFKGFLRGRYGFDPSVDVAFYPSTGWFDGKWIGKDLGIKGTLAGRWITETETGQGYFHGNWGFNCLENN